MGDFVPAIVAFVTVTFAKELVRPDADLAYAALCAAAYVLLAAFTWNFGRPARYPRAAPEALRGLLSLAGFVALAGFTPWVALAQRIAFGLPLLTALVALLPFFIAHLFKAAFTRPETLPPGRLGEHLRFRLRLLLVPMLPLVLLQALRDGAIFLFPDLAVTMEAYPPVLLLVVALSLLTIFSATPWILRVVTGSRPLPAGPLRERLEAYNRRHAFRVRQILVWHTGGTVPNAMFIGLLPFLRYVILTDALLARLPEDEIEAVYAHEAGHGQHHHVLLYMVLLFSTQTAIWASGGVAVALPQVDLDPATVQLASVILWLPALLLGFGWISRRFECEADFHASRTLDAPEGIDRALERVGLEAHVLGKKGGFRHYGIGRRLGLLNRYRSEPAFRKGYDRLLRRVRRGIVAFAVLAHLAFAVQIDRFLAEGDLRMAEILITDGPEDPARLVRASRLLEPLLEDRNLGDEASLTMHYVLASRADEMMKAGRFDEASRLLDRMRSLPLPRNDGRRLIPRINERLLEALLDACRGHGDAARLRELIEDLDELARAHPWLAGSEDLQQAYQELWLAVRASGDRAPLEAGDPQRWPQPFLRELKAAESEDRALPTAPRTLPAHILKMYELAAAAGSGD